MINPDFLKTFLTLSENQSFTKTARLLGMTQPGVSQHLKWLEAYYKTELVNRTGRTFHLTDAGKKVVDYARRLFLQHESFRSEIAKDDPHTGPCRFSSPGSYGIKMYSFLLSLNYRYPGLSIHYPYAPNETVIREVVEDRIDVGLVTLEPQNSEIEWRAVDQETLCLVAPRTQRKHSFESLLQLGLINHPDCPLYANRVLKANYPDRFRSLAEFPVKGFTNQITRILEPVALGFGFTVLPEYACRAFPNQAKLSYLRLKKEVRDPVYWIQKRGRRLPQRFEMIRQELKKQGAMKS